MRRLLARLAGLFVPRPPPRQLLTPRREFARQESALEHLNDELDFIRGVRRR